jgi:hypothetical protein
VNNPISLTLNKLILTFTVLSAISACGGGGGSAPSSPVIPPSGGGPSSPELLYQGKQDQAALTQNNFQAYVNLLLGDTFNTALDSVDGEFSLNSDNSLSGACGGRGAFTDNRSASTQLGVIEFDFTDFDDCSGTVISGNLIFNISRYDANRDEVTEFELTLENTRFVTQDSTLLMSGSVFNNVAENFEIEEFTSVIFDVQDVTNNRFYRLENFRETSYYLNFNDYFEQRANGLAFQGKIYISDYGYVDISTNGGSVCVKKLREACLVDKFKSGEVVFKGSSQAIALLSFPEHSQRDYEDMAVLDMDVDADGYFEFSSVQLYDRQMSNQQETDYPFVYMGRNAKLQYPITSQLDLNPVILPPTTSDDLFYSLRVSKELGCGFIQRIGSDFDNQEAILSNENEGKATLNVVGYGDYSVTLSVTNRGANRSNSDCIGLRFIEEEFLTPQFSDVKQELPGYNGRGVKSFSPFDFNDDNRLELVLKEGGQPKLQVYSQTSNGNFEFQSLLDVETNFTFKVQDLNGDGQAELISIKLSDFNTYSLNVQTITANMDIGAPQELIEFDSDFKQDSILLSDLDEDNLTDIIFLDDYRLQVFQQTQDGFSFTGEFNFPRKGEIRSYFSHQLADFNGDGVNRPYAISRDDDSLDVIEYNIHNGVLVEYNRFELISCDASCGFNVTGIRDFWAVNIDDSPKDELFIYGLNDRISIFNLNTDEVSVLSDFAVNYPAFKKSSNFSKFIVADFNNDNLTDILAIEPNNSQFGPYRSSVILQSDGMEFINEIRVPYQSIETLLLDLDGDGSEELLDFTLEKITVNRIR